MTHARNVKPRVAGATLRGFDESSIRNLPGFIRVVSRGNYLAVVCEREEQAIDAARRLQVDWDEPSAAPFPTSDELYAYMRSATPTSSADPRVVGSPEAALARAAQVLEGLLRDGLIAAPGGPR